MNLEDDWDYIGGCGVLHPFNKEKRAECEANKLAKRAAKPKNIESQTDLILAQEIANKSSQSSNSWTPLQISIVAGVSIVGLTIMIVVVKKITTKKS